MPMITNLANITVITAMECDDNIGEVGVVAKDEDKPPKKAHCIWTLTTDDYTAEEIEKIREFLNTSPPSDGYTFRCEHCGLNWMDNGPCGEECTGRLPPPTLYDRVKRDVIMGKREAQEELGRTRGMDNIYN